jgi:hypothetical protein
VKTYWRVGQEKMDATLEAIPALIEKGEKLLVVVSYAMKKEDREYLKEMNITLPTHRR